MQSAPEEPCILCVEDDEASRSVIAGALKGFQVEFAPDGHDAVTRYSGADAFDAFVLDVRLPDYNGLSICRDIRRLDPHVPIIVWTGLEGAEGRDWATEAGATTYIEKSERYDLLRSAVVEALASAEQRAESARALAARELAKMRGDSAPRPPRHQAAEDAAMKDAVRNTFLQGGGTLAQFKRWWGERAR